MVKEKKKKRQCCTSNSNKLQASSIRRKAQEKFCSFPPFRGIRGGRHWFIRQQHDGLTQSVGRMKAFVELEAYCRDTAMDEHW